MPELPEVETIVRELNDARLVGIRICEAKVAWPRSVAQDSVSNFCKRIKEQKILKISRRGKFIVFALSYGYLLVHLRMTGKFLIGTSSDNKDNKQPHERIKLELEDGRSLIYEDQRKFGKWYLVNDLNLIFNNLGVEPLSKEFTLSSLSKLLSKSRKKIKSFLLDQSCIVGLGNIYVDEALWEAKIHPLRPTNSLAPKEIKELHSAIKKVLVKGIENTGTSLGSHRANYFSVSGRRGGNQYMLKVFRREGHPCPRCGKIIIKIIVGQRGTHLCPSCQV